MGNPLNNKTLIKNIIISNITPYTIKNKNIKKFSNNPIMNPNWGLKYFLIIIAIYEVFGKKEL